MTAASGHDAPRRSAIIRMAGGALLVFSFCAASAPVRAQDALPSSFAQLPLAFQESSDPARQQKNYYDFMWRSFIALNWPNVPIEVRRTPAGPVLVSGFRGKPDTSRSMADRRRDGTLPLRVWETYKEPFEVFLDPDRWGDYPRWNTARPAPGGLARDAAARRLLRYPSGLAEYTTDFHQPYFFDASTGPLIDRHGHYVRYEVAVNQAFFTYMRHFGYYDAGRQKRAVTRWLTGARDGRAFQRPPFGNPEELGPDGYLGRLPPFARQGMIDVKAAWRVLDTSKGDRPERYLARKIMIDDTGVTKYMGLVALHILRYTPNGYRPGGPAGSFVAATFEQVDNVAVAAAAPAGLKPSFNSGAPPNLEQRTYGFEGPIPSGVARPDRKPVSIFRVTPLPPAVRQVNARYRNRLRRSVFRYYRLIGTQNKHPGPVSFKTPAARALNGHEGPTTGVYTNTNNLVNAALESYTQKNFSCILCHVRARPKGVPEKAHEVDHFKILTFLLQGAKSAPGATR